MFDLSNKCISNEDFNRIYKYFIKDYKNFYQFLGQTVDTKDTDIKREYKFEKSVYYEFAEYMVNLFFERENKFEFYEYDFDDCGMVIGFRLINRD